MPVREPGAAASLTPAFVAAAEDRQEQEDAAAASDHENLFLPDDRDDSGFASIIERGRRLLHDLAGRANRGEVVGVGYQQLLLALHGVTTLGQLVGRPHAKWSQAYGMWVIRLAVRITHEIGRVEVRRGSDVIAAGLDTFVWNKSTLDRSAGAWTPPWTRLPYSRQSWERIFPRPRRLLTPAEVAQIVDVVA